MSAARSLSLAEILDSAAFARAYAVTAFATAFGGPLIENLVGSATLTTIMVGLVLIGAAVLFVRRAELAWIRFIPSSIALILLWTCLSFAWSSDQRLTWIGIWGALGYAFLAIVIAHIRDSLQTVRAIGDVLRVLLALSIVVELLSGVFFDSAFEFLGVQGNITAGGPVQGIFETRNMLGLVSVIALVTFVVEFRTQSIEKPRAVVSIAMALALIGLSLSPTAIVLVGVVAASAGTLAIVRATQPERRNAVQLTLAALVVGMIVIGLVFRHQIIRWLGAGTDIAVRADLWNALLDYSRLQPWQGWGYFGAWAPNEFPFWSINDRAGEDIHLSALNAFFDVLIQLGIVGLVLFLFAAGLALTRAWLIATQRKSILYAWTPLVLITLLANSMLESTVLTSVGFMLFVLCATRAGQVKSWRELLDAPRPQSPSIQPG
ncbi:O-antigen ligase [Microbacterium sp. NC79]|uniref:O-antigen ligase family protein n=1 Tax=Microbacterium sp. NC79 TaxID=2851009 RepID=UPI001C2C87DB|nr:O-antigen ligase family protein [Microbacterium sp. NC79]MBV0894328.1 O-antigen ligase family protein [Microbacterium sp. NC79]